MRLRAIGFSALFLCIAGPAALAAQGAEDELLFNAQCALCHTARPWLPRAAPTRRPPRAGSCGSSRPRPYSPR